MKNLKEVDDTDIMPFGKYYKSRTTMAEVPASYLHWLWNDGLKKYELKQNSPRVLLLVTLKDI